MPKVYPEGAAKKNACFTRDQRRALAAARARAAAYEPTGTMSESRYREFWFDVFNAGFYTCFYAWSVRNKGGDLLLYVTAMCCGGELEAYWRNKPALREAIAEEACRRWWAWEVATRERKQREQHQREQQQQREAGTKAVAALAAAVAAAVAAEAAAKARAKESRTEVCASLARSGSGGVAIAAAVYVGVEGAKAAAALTLAVAAAAAAEAAAKARANESWREYIASLASAAAVKQEMASAGGSGAGAASLSKASQKTAGPLDEYMCPITAEIMTDPVCTLDGFTYERTAITEWLRTNDTSPATGARLESKKLIPNITVRCLLRYQ
jgi:pyruvate/2-oxoglutarate dehydrogenase complex dihydrolipoamide acyltransferase (E2) component